MLQLLGNFGKKLATFYSNIWSQLLNNILPFFDVFDRELKMLISRAISISDIFVHFSLRRFAMFLFHQIPPAKNT